MGGGGGNPAKTGTKMEAERNEERGEYRWRMSELFPNAQQETVERQRQSR